MEVCVLTGTHRYLHVHKHTYVPSGVCAIDRLTCDVDRHAVQTRQMTLHVTGLHPEAEGSAVVGASISDLQCAVVVQVAQVTIPSVSVGGVAVEHGGRVAMTDQVVDAPNHPHHLHDGLEAAADGDGGAAHRTQGPGVPDPLAPPIPTAWTQHMTSQRK